MAYSEFLEVKDDTEYFGLSYEDNDFNESYKFDYCFDDSKNNPIENCSSQQETELIKSRAKYKHGKESLYLKSKYCNFYELPYQNCKFYKIPVRKDKKFINRIGNEYNISFKDFIKTILLPKFIRYHKRNVGLAICFF